MQRDAAVVVNSDGHETFPAFEVASAFLMRV